MTGIPKSSRPTNLLTIKESQARKERPMTGLGIWRLGFRPFYLGAALCCSLGGPLLLLVDGPNIAGSRRSVCGGIL